MRIVFGRGSAGELARFVGEIEALGDPGAKLVVIATGGRRGDADRLAAALGPRSAGVLAIAREHVPIETVTEACAAVEGAGANGLVAYGGGSALGLAKAVAVTMSSRPLPIVAVPTTYSGSEMTPIYGITSVDGSGVRTKRTARSERARPALVLYDPELTVALPRKVAIASLWNAMAHAVEARWAPGAARATHTEAERALVLLATSIHRLATTGAPDDETFDEALEGAYLAGRAFADAGGGLHHKLCHILGGAFDMPHALTHATLLPHVVRWIGRADPAALRGIADGIGATDPDVALARLASFSGIPSTLRSVGFPGEKGGDPAAIDRVVSEVLAAPPPCPRALDREGLVALLTEATAEPDARGNASPAMRLPAKLEHLSGFGATHESEALPGALPRRQNAPRPAPYGLYAELLSGTPFTVKNALNSRVWMYRIRPSFSHGVFRPLPKGAFGDALTEVEPNRTRWLPPPIPTAPASVDFVDGLVTLGGEGTASGPGYRVSLYAANADMIDRAFSTADGDILVVPQSGTLDLRTELGMLRCPVGSIVIIPRGIKFAVGLPDGHGRGWLLEVFGPRLRLPERGPIGSNGLADARHFFAPVAAYEDRACPDGFEVVHKTGGSLFAAKQAHSPFDVVAWHGVHVPYVYDLMFFNAMGSVTWDHVDPSIHTVLTAPLDEQGRAVVDFVVFRGRWDVAEHSFRPPFMHRNAASEINCVVTTSTIETGYVPGCTFVSPMLASHGIPTTSYDSLLEMSDAEHEGPRRLPDDSIWVMFESSMAFRPTAWARATPLVDAAFLSLFDGMKSRFDPSRP